MSETLTGYHRPSDSGHKGQMQVYICDICGAIVENPLVHTAWHLEMGQ